MINETSIEKNIESFSINMNGKEYLVYKKYQDEKLKRISKRFWEVAVKFTYASRYFIMALFVYAMGNWLINAMYPSIYVSIPVNYGMFAIGSFILPYLLIYVVIILIAIAWLIHGVGFTIIKR